MENGFNYDFGIQIARGTVTQLALVTGAVLTVTGAIYGLMNTANQLEATLAKSRVAFGGYENTLNAMDWAQKKLLDGKTFFDQEDIMEGSKILQQYGLDAKKHFDLVNNMANVAGKTFTETGSAIEAAINGSQDALMDFGISPQTMKQFEKFEGNTVAMKGAIMGMLKANKNFADGFNKSLVSIPDHLRRMKGFATLFAQRIMGDPTDPNSLVNQVKNMLHGVNEWLNKYRPVIEKVGATIGYVLKWILRQVEIFAGWVGRKVGKYLDMVRDFLSNYQEKIMSMLLWLELAKGKVVEFFRAYSDQIKFALKAYLAFVAAMKVKELFTSGLQAGTQMWANLSAKATQYSGYAQSAWNVVSSGISRAAVMMRGLNLTMLLNPVGLVVAGVVALIAVSYLVWKHWDKIREKMQGVSDGTLLLLSLFVPILGIPMLLAKHWEKFKAIFTNIWRTISNVAQLFWLKLKAAALDFVNTIRNTFNTVRDFFAGLFQPLADGFNAVWGFVKANMGPLVALFEAFVEKLKPVKAFLALLFKPITLVIDAIKAFFSSDFIAKALTKLAGFTKGMANSSAEALAAEQRKQGLKVDVQRGVDYKEEKETLPGQKPKAKPIQTLQSPLLASAPGAAETSSTLETTSTVNVQAGAVTINMPAGSKASPEDVAREVERVLRRMNNKSLTQQGE